MLEGAEKAYAYHGLVTSERLSYVELNAHGSPSHDHTKVCRSKRFKAYILTGTVAFVITLQFR